MTELNPTAAMKPSFLSAERRLTEAVTALLLGRRKLKCGAVLLGGDPLDEPDLAWLAQAARACDLDVVHFNFCTRGEGVELAELTLAIPRDGVVWVQSGCRLWLPRHGQRALILPREGNRGYFRLAPRELIHVDGKPADIENGVERASRRLRALAARGHSQPGQLTVHEIPVAG